MMLTYNLFKEKVLNELPGYMPEEYRPDECIEYKVRKNNVEIDALSLRGGIYKTMSPSMSFGALYDAYHENGGKFDELMNSVADMLVNTVDRAPKVDADTFNDPEHRIIFQLVNASSNKKMLQDAPHRGYLDLAITYRYILSVVEDGMSGTVVTNQLMKMMGVTEEDLFRFAKNNTPNMLPAVFENIVKVIGEISETEGLGLCFSDIEETVPMYVITNKYMQFGSSAVLYDETLEHVSEIFSSYGGDFFLIPSSIHEMIATPIIDGIGEPKEIIELVKEVNATQVGVQERLSNSLYRYYSETKTLSVITDLTPITEE